ncbi:hypothetical protein HDU96_005359 [Phlyctochytrium bullatum]|nr:hypothetical protein HDU96_005359 [Phlyctochytrium bullatum]
MAFIIVKHGANEEHIVNPNCLCSVLLSHIKKIGGFQDMPENIDLASETGEVVDLVSKPREYAKKYLEPRSNYIVVKVIGEETEDSSPTYVSLLDQVGDRIKFAVLNPTQRQRSKAKAGSREPPRFLGSDDAKDSQSKDATSRGRKDGNAAKQLAAKSAANAAGSGAPSMDELHKEGGGGGGGGAGEKKKGKGGGGGGGAAAAAALFVKDGGKGDKGGEKAEKGDKAGAKGKKAK